jgi:uncharacterized protein
MSDKPGRNDPCTCGSGKKYKSCCMNKPPLAKKKITATKMTGVERKPVDLMERTFGPAIERTWQGQPPIPPEEVSDIEKGHIPL